MLRNSFIKRVNILNCDSGIYFWGTTGSTVTDVMIGTTPQRRGRIPGSEGEGPFLFMGAGSCLACPLPTGDAQAAPGICACVLSVAAKQAGWGAPACAVQSSAGMPPPSTPPACPCLQGTEQSGLSTAPTTW
jgi:hypothetical protein